MQSFFKPNLEVKGRIIRLVIGLVLLGSAVYAFLHLPWLGFILLASSGFVLFEAFRGWCLVRACGIKTRY